MVSGERSFFHSRVLSFIDLELSVKEGPKRIFLRSPLPLPGHRRYRPASVTNVLCRDFFYLAFSPGSYPSSPQHSPNTYSTFSGRAVVAKLPPFDLLVLCLSPTPAGCSPSASPSGEGGTSILAFQSREAFNLFPRLRLVFSMPLSSSNNS